jgi:hypothetical protein
MTDEAPTAKVIEHRGRTLQVHVADWLGAGAQPTPHLHIQDVAGGPGEIVPVTSPRARELAASHDELHSFGVPQPEGKEAELEDPERIHDPERTGGY